MSAIDADFTDIDFDIINQIVNSNSELTIVDALERHLKSPATFQMPGFCEIEEVRPGDTVKIIINDKERVWATVLQTFDYDGSVWFVGQLEDVGYYLKFLNKNTILFFNHTHIIEIYFAHEHQGK